MHVSVIIPVYNRQNFIKACVNSVLNQKFENYEIIVVDDGSTDRTTSILNDLKSKTVRIIQNRVNKGTSFSRNRGIELAKGQFVLFTDSDCVVDKTWIEEVIRPFEYDDNICIVGGKIIDKAPDNYWETVNKGINFIHYKEGYVKKIDGCNMAFKKEFLMNNRFDETMRLFAADELDMCIRCTKKKGKIYYTPSARVIHCHRSSFAGTLKQQFQFGCQNSRTFFKHKIFPYLSVGSWLLIFGLLMILMSLILGLAWRFAMVMFTLYLMLTIYVSTIPHAKTLNEFILTFPGFFMSCLANSAGNIFFLFSFIGVLWKQQDSNT